VWNKQVRCSILILHVCERTSEFSGTRYSLVTNLVVCVSMNVVLEFSGGAELLFGKVRQHTIVLPNTTSESNQSQVWSVGQLLVWIKENLLRERPELFLKDPTASKLDVRPGILVLINEADWELMGQTDYILEEGDTVAFISTLHGG